MTRRNGLLSALSLVVAGALIGLFVVACGIRPSGVISGQEAPHGAVASLIVYLLDHGTLRAVARPLPPPPTRKPDDTYMYPDPQQQSLDALMQGPTAEEAAGGLTSDLPQNSLLIVVRPGATHLPQVYAKYDGGQPLSQHALDQIACTLITSINNTGYEHTNDFKVQVFDGSGRRDAQGCPVRTP